MVGPDETATGWSNTDFVNSGSYFLMVFVLISGITTLVGFTGGAGFFGGGILISPVFLISIAFTSGAFSSFFGITGCLTSGSLIAAFFIGEGGATGDFATSFGAAAALTAGLISTFFTGIFSAGFFTCTGGAALAAFLGTGLAAFDGFAAGFLAGAVFFTGVFFLAGLATFFLVAILSGFF
jgi:hypothetical protein